MAFEFESDLENIRETIAVLEQKSMKGDAAASARIAELRRKLATETARVYSSLTPWDRVQVARHPGRPTIDRYAHGMCDDFVEIHGDRVYGDDPAMLCGFARIAKTKFMLIGHRKGDNTEENIKYNFGMANPEGYRKAMRAMHLAEKWGLPVVTMIDTAGAFPGMEAEARGQAEAIGRNLMEMAALETPILSIVTGEGGSGGALGIGVGDKIYMLENAIYSVISPEGCASILLRDSSRAKDAAAMMKITSREVLGLKVINGVIPEADGGAHRDPLVTANAIRERIISDLADLRRRNPEVLVKYRNKKIRETGAFYDDDGGIESSAN